MAKRIFRNEKPRWSCTIGQYNLVGLCLRDRGTVFAWIMRKLRIKDKWDSMRETKSAFFSEKLEDTMFREAKRRAQNVSMKNILVVARSYKGSKTLERYNQEKTLGWTLRRDFDESIILWHIATDLCFHEDSYDLSSENESEPVLSWQVSNYMVYLQTKQPLMMQPGHNKHVFSLTCRVVKKILKGVGKFEDRRARELIIQEPIVSHSFLTESEELGIKVIADARRLAKELHELVTRNVRWKLISEIWIEMLGYAAIHCDSQRHVKTLSRGGELLTHFWLLMAHMGVVEEHRMQEFQSDESV